MTTPDATGEPTRAELERIAYGRATTPAEIDASLAALRRLVDADAAVAAAARVSAEPEATPKTIDVEYDPVASDPEPAPARRRRTLVPLLVVVGLFAGAAIGILATRPESATITPGAALSSTPTPIPTPNAADALRLLLVPQTKADKQYPFLFPSAHGAIQPASVHRILTAADGATLWVGRSDTDICMMWSKPDTTDSGIGGGVTCSTPGEFAKHGLMLSEGDNGWSWNGIQFTLLY